MTGADAKSMDEQVAAARAFMTAVTGMVHPVMEAMRQTVAALAEAMGPVFDAILRVGHALREAVHQGYLEAGAPYGDTEDGMMRWWHERSEAAALESQAEYIRQQHEMVVSLRQQLKEEP